MRRNEEKKRREKRKRERKAKGRIKQKQKGKRGEEGKKRDAVSFVLHFRERVSSFSLESWEIRPLDSFQTRREVVLHGEDNAWTPVFGSFFNFQEVGYFPTRFIFSLKAL